jgi:hypothetical protein
MLQPIFNVCKISKPAQYLALIGKKIFSYFGTFANFEANRGQHNAKNGKMSFQQAYFALGNN